MENLVGYVNRVHDQIAALLNPEKPAPTEEQLLGYAAKVVGSLSTMIVPAPTTVKEKVDKAFAGHWNLKDNVPGPDGITAIQLHAAFKFLVDELHKMAPKIQPAAKEPTNKKNFTGEQITEIKTLPDESFIGRIVGPKGQILKELEAASSCKLNISGTAISITGPKDGAEIAIKAIDDIISKGFSSYTMGEDFAEVMVKVHPDRIPDIIGQKGVNIIAIKEKCDVQINITDSGKGAPKGKGKSKGAQKKAQVLIGGSKKNVEKAREVLNAILNEYHHPITHPDFVHEEIEVQSYHYNMIIGKKGSEIKHMQNSFHVRVYIPNENTSHTGVIVVGEPKGVETCKRHIENVIWKVDNRPARGEDMGGYGEDVGEDEVEPWMKQYLYNRQP